MRNLLFIIVFLLLLPLQIFAQKDSTITIRLEQVTLREALQEIQDKSEFQVFYNEELPALEKEVSLRVRKADIYLVLDSLLTGSALTYQVLDDNFIVVATSEGFEKHEVSGQVVASENGESIPGVHVVIKGTTTGTITDINGKFNILAPGGETILVISFLGYEPVEIPSGGLTNIRVTLKESRQEILCSRRCVLQHEEEQPAESI